jgi:hypothetical protein
VLFAAGAFVVAGALGWIPLELSPGVPRWVGAAAGFAFAVAGVIVSLPPRESRLVDSAAATLVSLFAAIGGWVAFAPGERHFSSSVSVGGIAASGDAAGWAGRIAFGIGAILCGVFAALLWKRVLFPPAKRDDAPPPGA